MRKDKTNLLANDMKSKFFVKDFNSFRDNNLVEEKSLLFKNNRYANVLCVQKKRKRKEKTFVRLFKVKKRTNLLKYSTHLHVLKEKSRYLALRKRIKRQASKLIQNPKLKVITFPTSKLSRRFRFRKNDGLFFRKLAEIVKFYKDYLDLFVDLKITEMKHRLFIVDKMGEVLDPSRSVLKYRVYSS